MSSLCVVRVPPGTLITGLCKADGNGYCSRLRGKYSCGCSCGESAQHIPESVQMHVPSFSVIRRNAEGRKGWVLSYGPSGSLHKILVVSMG